MRQTDTEICLRDNYKELRNVMSGIEILADILILVSCYNNRQLRHLADYEQYMFIEKVCTVGINSIEL